MQQCMEIFPLPRSLQWFKQACRGDTSLAMDPLFLSTVPPKMFFVSQAGTFAQFGQHWTQWSLRILLFHFSSMDKYWVLSCVLCFMRLGDQRDEQGVCLLLSHRVNWELILCHWTDSSPTRTRASLSPLLKHWGWTAWLPWALPDLTFYNSIKPKWESLGLGEVLMQKLGQG